jgi:hypothetical protein
LLLLRDENKPIEQNSDTLALLRQCIYVLQQRSPRAMTTAGLTDLIQADRLIPFHQLQAVIRQAAQQVKLDLGRKILDLWGHFLQEKENFKQQFINQPSISYATIKQLQASTLEEESQLGKQVAELEAIIAGTALYSREAFNKLIGPPQTIQETIKKQYGTVRIQVFENFLALPPEQQPDVYKQRLLEQLFTWSAREIAVMSAKIEAKQLMEEEIIQLAGIADYFIEERQAQELAAKQAMQSEIERFADLADYFIEERQKQALARDKAKLEVYQQQAQPTQQADESSKVTKPRLSWANIITLLSISLFIGGGVAAGLFFINLPIWSLSLAGVGTMLACFSLLTAGYFFLQEKTAKSRQNDGKKLLQTPIQYAAPYTASKSVTVSLDARPDAPQPTIPAAENNFSLA